MAGIGQQNFVPSLDLVGQGIAKAGHFVASLQCLFEGKVVGGKVALPFIYKAMASKENDHSIFFSGNAGEPFFQ